MPDDNGTDTSNLVPVSMIGRTFIIPNTGPPDNPQLSHLFVAIMKPCYFGRVVFVPISRIKKNHDPACMLGPTDHPFVQVPSFIAYRHARIYETAAIDMALADGSMRERQPPFRGRVLGFICHGATTSNAISLRLRSIVSCNSNCKKCLIV